MVLQSISYLSMDLNIVVILKNHQLSLVREWAEQIEKSAGPRESVESIYLRFTCIARRCEKTS